MKTLKIIIVLLLLVFYGCSGEDKNKTDFDVVDSNVTIWRESTGEYSIVLAFEVSNLSVGSVFFKESDFDIVDENGNIIETMKAVSAYPPVIKPKEMAVYYEVKKSNNISNADIELSAIPHINTSEADKSKDSGDYLAIVDTNIGGSSHSAGIVKNISYKTEYNNVHIAVITRNSSNEVISVMTAELGLMKPGEQKNYIAKDRLEQRDISLSIASNCQYIIYIDP